MKNFKILFRNLFHTPPPTSSILTGRQTSPSQIFRYDGRAGPLYDGQFFIGPQTEVLWPQPGLQ